MWEFPTSKGPGPAGVVMERSLKQNQITAHWQLSTVPQQGESSHAYFHQSVQAHRYTGCQLEALRTF